MHPFLKMHKSSKKHFGNIGGVNFLNCYGNAIANDTVYLHIMVMGDTVTGDAVFQYAGKDKNTGTLAGEMNGDTLIASYKFMSEGKEIVRQIAFLKRAKVLAKAMAKQKKERVDGF